MPKFYLNQRPGHSDMFFLSRNPTATSVASYKGDVGRAARALSNHHPITGNPEDYKYVRGSLPEFEKEFRSYGIDTGGASPVALALVLAVIIAVSCEVVYVLAFGVLDSPFSWLVGVRS